ncbi:MAG: endonuclease III [Firmicutes bacterium]|nr:endonuclease III [Bacillota bacterium]
MLTKKNVVKVIDALEKEYPDAACALDYGTLYQLLVSVMLSAQTTDASVNKATPALFAAAPDAQSMVKLSEEEIQNYIRSIGLYKNKSKSLLAMSRQLLDRFGGEVPRDYDSLVSLPGVGRKTANVVLAEGFGQQQIAVDTHVFRLANRIGLTAEKNVLRTELGLQRAIPNDKWTLAHHALIFHGRRCCHARGPECGRCPINDVCEKNGVNDVQTL